MKVLVDECLSKQLAEVARDAGYPESAHLSERGLLGTTDWQLMERIQEEDWTLVTRNSDDFRPRPGSTSQAPCYLGVEIHAGLICLNLPQGATLEDQVDWFEAVLAHLGPEADPVNTLIDVYPDDAGGITILEQDFPEEEP